MSWLAVILVIFVAALPTNGQLAEAPDAGNKCGGCSCNNPCPVPPPPVVLPPPPPPPPVVLPPPPPPPPVVLPPPPPKKPPSPKCPPPPSGSGPDVPNIPTPPSQYVYFTAPPGNLYPVDQYFSGAARGFVGFPLLIGSIFLAFW